MSWEYYDQMPERIEEVVNYFLRLDANPLSIIDLNCGKVPLFDKLPSFVYSEYIANDILGEFPQDVLSEYGKPQYFLKWTDEKISGFFEDLVEFRESGGATVPDNALVLLGHPGYPKHQGEGESTTVNESMNRIIRAVKPKIVVIESVEDFVEVVDKEIDLTGYELELDKPLDLGDSWIMKRRVRAWKRS